PGADRVPGRLLAARATGFVQAPGLEVAPGDDDRGQGHERRRRGRTDDSGEARIDELPALADQADRNQVEGKVQGDPPFRAGRQPGGEARVLGTDRSPDRFSSL